MSGRRRRGCDDAGRHGMKDADGTEGVDDAGGVAGVKDVRRDAGRDDSAGTVKDRFFFHADVIVPEPWLLWMPSRLSPLAVVALRADNDGDDGNDDD